MAHILVRSSGGAHSASIACITGNVTPSPSPEKMTQFGDFV
jgi:hypothetical protein